MLNTDRGKYLLDGARDAWALLSGILCIAHPKQYEMGLNIHAKMKARGRCRDAIGRWPSAQTAISIISNRATPFHRDEKSRMQWYDLLTSIGTYTKAPLYLSPLNMRFDNTPGSVCLFSGMAIRHGVRKCGGSRIAIASYLRDDVREGEKIAPADWMTQMVYFPYIGRTGIRIKHFRR